MVLVTSFQIVSAQVYVLYGVSSQISHYVSREETERLSSTESFLCPTISTLEIKISFNL